MAHHSSQEQAVRFFTGRAHVGIPRGPLPIPAAWRGDSMRARGDFRYHLSSRELAEIDAGLAHATATGKPTIELTAQDLPLPTLRTRIARWRDELRDGVGFVVISGVPVDTVVAGRSRTVFLDVRRAPRNAGPAESAGRPTRPRHRYRRRRNRSAGAALPHRQQHQLSLRRRRRRRAAVPQERANGRTQPHRELGDGVQRTVAPGSRVSDALCSSRSNSTGATKKKPDSRPTR